MYINTNLQIREALGPMNAPGEGKKKKVVDSPDKAAEVTISANHRETATVNQDSRLNGMSDAKALAARLREKLMGDSSAAMGAQGNVSSHSVANLLTDN